jgi:hypothetical protein
MNKETENFLEELKNDPKVKSVILFGSHARGNARENSDVDLIVVCEETKRGVEKRNNQFIELVFVTEADAEEYYLKNKDNAVRTWMTAQILYDNDGSANRLKQLVQNIVNEGKQKVAEDTLNHLRFDTVDLFQTVRAILDEKPIEALHLLNIKLLSLLELFFDIKGIWTPAPKQLLGEIQNADKELYKLVSTFYTAHSVEDKIKTAEEISNRILG